MSDNQETIRSAVHFCNQRTFLGAALCPLALRDVRRRQRGALDAKGPKHPLKNADNILKVA